LESLRIEQTFDTINHMEFGLAIEPETVLKQVLAALDDALELPVHLLSNEALGEWTCMVNSAVTGRVDALRSKAAAACVATGVAGAVGIRSVDQYVAARVPVDPAAVRFDLRLAEFCGEFPLFGQALARGHMSSKHVDLIRRGAKRRLRPFLHDSQEYLVAAARDCDWVDFGVAWAHWLIHADPDGEAPREQLDERFMSYRKHPDGTVTGSFRLDPAAGSHFLKSQRTEERRLRDDEAELAGTEHEIERTNSHRRADAFSAIVARGQERSDSKVGAPTIELTLGEELAEDMIASALQGDNRPLRSSHTDPNRRCELIDGTPIHPHLAMVLLALGDFRRLVLDADSRIHEFGDSTRTLPDDVKHAVYTAARGRCRTRGCDAPFSWLQIDHRIPWSKNGPTSVENSDVLCGGDNGHKSNR
jgi:hypothetical protein